MATKTADQHRADAQAHRDEVAVRTDGGFSRDVEVVTADAGYEKN